MKRKTKTLLLCGLIVLLTAVSAVGILYLSGTFKKGNRNVLGVAWYHENETEFEITTVEQLYDLARLSEYYDFEGQTIKLGADIVLNVGLTSDWEAGGTSHEWIGIGTRYVTFAGVFNGNMHTISGLYINSTERFQGLFCGVGEGGSVKNLKLTNSFIKSTGADIGSIAGLAQGRFESVYSSALVHVSTPRVGGMFGQISGTNVVMNQCWFDGLVKHTGNLFYFSTLVLHIMVQKLLELQGELMDPKTDIRSKKCNTHCIFANFCV